MAGGDTMPVKNRLKEIRHELYIDTQKEFAELVGVTRQQINLWENQKTQPAIETLVKLWGCRGRGKQGSRRGHDAPP